MARRRTRPHDPGVDYEPAQLGTYRLEVNGFDGGEGDAYRVRMYLTGPRQGYWWSVGAEMLQEDLDHFLAEDGSPLDESDAGRVASAMAELVVEWVVESIEDSQLPRTDLMHWRVTGDDIGRIVRRARGRIEIEVKSTYEIELTARGGAGE